MVARPGADPPAGALWVSWKTGMFCTTANSVGTPPRATVRGKAMVLVSLSVFRKDNTAETPSALRKAVAGLRPRAVLSEKPPPCEVLPEMVLVKVETLLERVVMGDGPEAMGAPPGEGVLEAVPLPVVEEEATVPCVKPLPKLTCCACNVPVQSTPLAVVMSLLVCTILAST